LGKKQDLIKAAVRLFADQGFDGTTTLQIANEAGVTEPLLYYHFTNKDGLFTHILSSTFAEYFSRLESLDNNAPTQFKKIENLITMHFQFVKDMPDETYLAISTCPARLRDPETVCAKNIEIQRNLLTSYLTDCLERGIQTGEFNEVPANTTANLLMTMINGLMRQRGLRFEHMTGLMEEAVEFCRRSLIKNEYPH